MTKRTSEQIANAVYEVSLGNFIDTDRAVAQAQNALISALVWRECAPAGGWHEKARAQIDALKAIAEMPAPEVAEGFEGLVDATMTHSEEIGEHIKNINDCLDNKRPWNYEFIDKLINDK